MSYHLNRPMLPRMFSVLLVSALLATPILPQTAVSATAQQGTAVESTFQLPLKQETKLDSQLQQLVDAATEALIPAFAQAHGIDLVPDNRVRVIIETLPGRTSDLLGKAQVFGSMIEATHENLVQALVPVGMLNAITAETSVGSVRMPAIARSDVISQGRDMINADDWQVAGYNGAGVKVGILDKGFLGYSSLLGSELPPSVATWWAPGLGGPGTSVHGTAVAEILYDIAPGATFYLANFTTEVEWNNAIDWFIGQGVNVISCSVSWFGTGPGNGIGSIDAGVLRAWNSGIFWSQSAGNSAQRHWSGHFSDSGQDIVIQFEFFRAHIFSGGDWTNTISAIQGQEITAILRWEDAWGASYNDYDLFILNESMQIVAVSGDEQNGNDYPVEGLSYTVPTTGTYHIAIGNWRNQASNVTFHLYVLDQTPEYRTATRSITEPADSPYAVTVGAVAWNTPTAIEYFSSQGPTTDNRTKPDIVAPDGVETVSFGTSPFYGTSASAAHVAGAAVLVKDMYSAYTPAQIKIYLETNAVDLGTSGKDSVFGSGLLNLPSLLMPEMTVFGNNGNGIADGDTTPSNYDFTDFGDVAVTGGISTPTFTIKNIGTAALNLTGTPKVVVSGPNAGDFTITSQPTSPLDAPGLTMFVVKFDPSDLGLRTASISISNNDADENPYDFSIQGTGVESTLTLTTPNGGESWAYGSTQRIYINHNSSLNGTVSLFLSTDAGLNWSLIREHAAMGYVY